MSINIMSMLSYAKYAFLVAYVLFAFFKTNKGKSLGWMLSHLVVIAAGGWAVFSHVEWYLLLGIATVVVGFVKQLIAGQVNSGNLMSVLKTAGSNLLFYPVSAFEQLYSSITSQQPTV